MESRSRDISRRRVLVALIGSVAAAGSSVAQQKPQQKQKPPAQNTIDKRVPLQIRKIIVEQLGVDDEEVRWESGFVGDLGADSLDVVELVMAFEEEFKVEIPDQDAEKIVRVGQLVEYLRKRKALK